MYITYRHPILLLEGHEPVRRPVTASIGLGQLYFSGAVYQLVKKMASVSWDEVLHKNPQAMKPVIA